MSDTFRTRKILFESCTGKNRMRVTKSQRIESNVDDKVDVVGRTDIRGFALHLVKEHHLTAGPGQRPAPSHEVGE